MKHPFGILGLQVPAVGGLNKRHGTYSLDRKVLE